LSTLIQSSTVNKDEIGKQIDELKAKQATLEAQIKTLHRAPVWLYFQKRSRQIQLGEMLQGGCHWKMGRCRF
jgi:cell division protein FtsB